MQDLVDQAHCADIARADGGARIGRQVALLVHFLGEAARSRVIGEHDVAVQAEESLVEAVAVARLA